MRLLPCIYTGVKTCWRRADGEPALSEVQLETHYGQDREFIAACKKHGFGIKQDDTPKAKKPGQPRAYPRG